MAKSVKEKAYLDVVEASEAHSRNGHFWQTMNDVGEALSAADKAGLTLAEQAQASNIGDVRGREIEG